MADLFYIDLALEENETLQIPSILRSVKGKENADIFSRKRVIFMYGKLWSFVNHYIDEEHALAVYLPILIIGWTIVGTVLGMGVCSVIRINLVQSLSDIICAGGYAGIILGLFGGILYLYRK